MSSPCFDLSSLLLPRSEDLLQRSFVPRRYLLPCEAKNFCISKLGPHASRWQERTRSRNSLLGNNRLRSIRCFFIRFPPLLASGTFVPQTARIPPPTKDVKQLDLSPKIRTHIATFLYVPIHATVTK